MSYGHEKSLGVHLMLCLINKIVVVGFPLGPISCAAYIFGPTVPPGVVSSCETKIKSSQNVVDSSHVCGTNLSMDTAYQAGIVLTHSTGE